MRCIKIINVDEITKVFSSSVYYKVCKRFSTFFSESIVLSISRYIHHKIAVVLIPDCWALSQAVSLSVCLSVSLSLSLSRRLLSRLGGYTTKSVTHEQCETRSTVTFRTVLHSNHLTFTKLLGDRGMLRVSAIFISAVDETRTLDLSMTS